MDDTAVSDSLVLRKILLLFQDEDARPGMLIAHGPPSPAPRFHLR
jgi:hypothetical protein